MRFLSGLLLASLPTLLAAVVVPVRWAGSTGAVLPASRARHGAPVRQARELPRGGRIPDYAAFAAVALDHAALWDTVYEHGAPPLTRRGTASPGPCTRSLTLSCSTTAPPSTNPLTRTGLHPPQPGPRPHPPPDANRWRTTTPTPDPIALLAD